MKDLIRHTWSRTAALADVAVVVVFVAAGITAAQGKATPILKANKASHRQLPKFKHPTIRHGVLTIEGTEGSDKIALRLEQGDASILQVDVGDDGSADFSFERGRIAAIAVDAGAGDDVVRIDESNGAFTDSIPTAIAGGDGNDTIAGGKGVELLLGGAGNDTIDGNGGNDVALLGAGGDTFVWDPGDGSDVVEGGDGTDTMVFNGANIADQVDLSANGHRLRFFRNPGNITMDTAGVERVAFNALGGADSVTVNDLSGTDVRSVDLDLGSADGAADHVVVNGSGHDDAIDVSGDAGGVKVSGLVPTTAIFHAEPTDRLDVNTLAGNDTVDSAGLAAGTLPLFVDGVLVP